MIKKLTPPALLINIIIACGGLCGCNTVYRSGDITHVTERVLGLEVDSTSASTQTPTIKFGFSSTSFDVIPTSTNVVFAPRFMSAFANGNSANPFDVEIRENVGSGDVLLGVGTNDTSRAIVPSPVRWGTNAPSATAPSAPAASK